MSITIKVLFFASAREAAGDIASTEVTLDGTAQNPPDTSTLRQHLAKLYPKLAPLILDEENLTLALNEEYVVSGKPEKLKSGDTVALIPPISGG